MEDGRRKKFHGRWIIQKKIIPHPSDVGLSFKSPGFDFVLVGAKARVG